MPLDIGVGIFASVFLGRFFGIAFTPIFLAGGILFSLLPDFDFLFTLKKGTTARAHEHRDLFHYPLLFIPIGTIIISFFDYRWAALFAITTFLHFLHDSIGLGWGVRWFYPLSQNYYAFFYQYDISRNKLPAKTLYVWSGEDVRRLSVHYGDKDWIKNIYLRFHPYAIAEFLVFLFSLVILYEYWLR
ncbi:MAG: metal-dependent hydrolase [Minisyncoccia bacterium]